MHVKPVHELMGEANVDWTRMPISPRSRAYYTTSGGRLLSLPFNSSTPVLWYNQDLLDMAGAEVPTTWDEVFALADKLQAKATSAPILSAGSPG